MLRAAARVAVSDSVEMVVPSVVVWSAGVVMLIGLLMFQVKNVSGGIGSRRRLHLTLYGPVWAASSATVPEMAPLLLLMLRPGGRPTAE